MRLLLLPLRSGHGIAASGGPVFAGRVAAGPGRRRNARCLALLLVGVVACGPRPGSEVRDDVRLGVVAAPTSLDPHLQDETAAYNVLVNVYEGLVALDGELRLQPALATSWSNPDELTYRFRLRSGVRFHDGRPLGVEDVVASLERVLHHPQSQVGAYLAGVKEVRAAAADTVDVHLEAPSAVLLNKLAFLWVAPGDAPQRVEEPIGTGPYRWVGRGPGGEHRLEAFGDYWGDPPAIRSATFRAVAAGSEREALVERAEVDLVESPSAEFLLALGPESEVVGLGRETAEVAYLHLGTTSPPFDDVRVRRAVHLAMDRDAIVEGPLGGFAEPAHQLASRQVFGYDPSIPPVERDVEEARRLLAAAGWNDGLDVVLEHPSPNATAVLLAGQLAEAGFRVRHEGSPWAQMYERLRRGEVDFYFGLVSMTSGDASDVLESKLHGRDPDTGLGGGNFNGYSNPELDRLIERSRSLVDPAERLAALQECMRIVMEDLPLVPVYVPRSRFAVRRALRFEPRVDSALELARMSWEPTSTSPGGR